MGTRYTICRWAINRSDPQNLLSVTLDVPLQLQSDPVADLILLRNIGSYSHHSESTLLPPNALSLFRPWLPMQEHEDTVVYNVDYSLQEPHLIL